MYFMLYKAQHHFMRQQLRIFRFSEIRDFFHYDLTFIYLYSFTKILDIFCFYRFHKI